MNTDIVSTSPHSVDLLHLRYRWMAKSLTTHRAQLETEELKVCDSCLAILLALSTQSRLAALDVHSADQCEEAYTNLNQLINRAYRRAMGPEVHLRASYQEFHLHSPATVRKEDPAP